VLETKPTKETKIHKVTLIKRQLDQQEYQTSSNQVTEKILNGPLHLREHKTFPDQITFNSSQLHSEEEIITNTENQ